MYYILDGHEPVPAGMMEWAKFFEHDENRRVALDHIEDPLSPSEPAGYVSTVFLGLDHGYGEGPPLIFETMIFWDGHDLNHYQARCSTWEQALEMHASAIRRVVNAQDRI